MEPDCQVGQLLEISVTPQDFGRIAAAAARQIIAQKLKGAERDVIYEEYDIGSHLRHGQALHPRTHNHRRSR